MLVAGFFTVNPLFARAADSVQLNGAGSSFDYPLFSKAFAAYSQEHPDVQINYQSIGSGNGVKALTDKTEDFGETWKSIRNNLPAGSSRCLREDIQNRNLLYCGTEFALFASLDRGKSWTKINNNLPTVAVHEVAIHPTAGEIVAATHGRSLWIVDALLGTGASGPPREPFATAIRAINSASALRLAVDLPSGLDCDTGEPGDPTVQAHHTCTFVAPKTGFGNPAAAPYLGHVHILDIGAPRCLLNEYAT